MEVVSFRVNGASTKDYLFQKQVRVKAFILEGDSKVGSTVSMSFDDVKGTSADGTPFKKGVETDSMVYLSNLDVYTTSLKIENNSASAVALITVFYEYE